MIISQRYRAITCLRLFLRTNRATYTAAIASYYRMHRIVHPVAQSWSAANASRYNTNVRTYTHISSRNSAVHFYYLPFYGRKSLPHADSRCAEGRRASAEGLVKTQVRGSSTPSYAFDDEAGMGYVCMYVRAFDTLVPGTNSVSSLNVNVTF